MRSKQNCSLNSIIYYVKRKPWFIVQLVLLFFVISNSYLHHIGLINALMFYVVQLLFFYIPGRAFTEIVLKSKTSSIKRYFFSYIFLPFYFKIDFENIKFYFHNLRIFLNRILLFQYISFPTLIIMN